MSSVAYQTGKNGTKYAYESESFRDPVTHKPKSKRKYLGRVDPETGMIIPKAAEGKRNRSKIGKYEGQLPPDFLEGSSGTKAPNRRNCRISSQV